MNEIILINPPPLNWTEKHDALNHPHLGLGYISAYLRENGFKPKPIDAKFERMDMERLA